MIICNTDYFEFLTKGNEYEIKDTVNDQNGLGDLVVIENNAGQKRAYHSSWFY